MKQKQEPKVRPLTEEKRRTLAYLLVAQTMGMNVLEQFDHLPEDPEDSYESMVVRTDIRIRFAHEPERVRFQRRTSQMLDKFDKGEFTDEMRNMYDWMIEHIVFPEWDDEEYRKHWKFDAFKQRQQKANKK